MAEEGKSEVKADSGGSGQGKLFLILGAVNLLVSVGIIAVLFMTLQKEKHVASVEDIAVGAKGGTGNSDHSGGVAQVEESIGQTFGKMLPLQQFTVNLSTSGSANPKFARVKISFELPSDDTEAEVSRKMPRVRNTIIDLFNSKRPSDLSTPEGRNYLKEEIRNAVNSFLISGQVKGVFFTSFALSG